MNYRNAFFYLSFSLILFSGCGREKGFSLKKISSHHPFNPRWETPPLTSEEKKEILLILEQPFHYLGSGNHCYAFVSEDGAYVIKFFKQNQMGTGSWPQKTFSQEKWKKKKENRESFFTSYKLAFEHLKKETGLLYIQLNKKKEFSKILALTDQNGLPFSLATDDSEFLLQKKADIGYAHLSKLCEEKNVGELKEALSSLFNLVAKRCKKGLADSDLQLYKNWGFIGNQAIEIDVGALQVDEKAKSQENLEKELDHISSQLKQWAEENFAQEEPLLSEMIEEAKASALTKD